MNSLAVYVSTTPTNHYSVPALFGGSAANVLATFPASSFASCAAVVVLCKATTAFALALFLIAFANTKSSKCFPFYVHIHQHTYTAGAYQ